MLLLPFLPENSYIKITLDRKVYLNFYIPFTGVRGKINPCKVNFFFVSENSEN